MDIRAERLVTGLSQAELSRAANVPQPNLSAYENGRRTPSPDVLERIRAALATRLASRVARNREAIHAIVRAHHASAPRVFGSVARGHDGPGSDIDFLVDFDEEASLLDETGLRLALRDLLRVEVDLVGADTLKGSVRRRILDEAQPV